MTLVVGVTLAHLLASDELLTGRFGGDLNEHPDRPPRIEVAYVQDLLPTAPPVLARAPAPRPKKRLPAVVPRAQAASEPDDGPAPPAPLAVPEPASEPVRVAVPEPVSAPVVTEAPPLEPAQAVPTIAPVAQSSPEPAAPAPGASAASASAETLAQPFSWPPSTRLTYALNGNYRGEVRGSAQVEWVREGSHYQVHLSALVGPSFAPLMARRLSSDGELGEQGLTPRRFDGEQRVGFTKRQWNLQFTEQRVTLADGRQALPLPGVQDEASQFVQLAWLFTTQPQRLAPGQAVEVPLALPRRLERWIYDVVGEEQLTMPFGPLPAFHLKPRRPGRPGEMTAQIWIAPTLQYLPVRILIHQDEQTWVDLMLERAPQQAAK